MDVLNSLVAGGKHSCRALIGCAVLALVVVAPAVAQPFDPDPNSILRPNTQSIESETTFDLFENEYDYALMPSYMGFFEDAGRYYTQLGNIGGEDMFQFMSYRPLGPGYYSFRVQFSSEEAEFTTGDRLEDFIDDGTPDDGNVNPVPDIEFDEIVSEDETQDFGVYLGYAWPITENGSLGFALEYSKSSFETQDIATSIDDPRAGQGSPASDDITTTNAVSFDDEDEALTLIGEFMHRGDMSWRVRAYVSDIDNTFQSTQNVNQLILVDNDDEEGGGSLCSGTVSCENDIFIELNGSSFGGGIEGGPSFLEDISHDGMIFGGEGELRWEKNPKIHHQLNVGLATGDFDPKDDQLQNITQTVTVIDDPSVVDDTTVDTFTSSDIITDDDISFDSQFVTWRTRGHFGDTHCGVGLYWFNSKSEFEVGADSITQLVSETFDDGDVTDSTTTIFDESFFNATSEVEFQSISIPLALEQDVTDRVQVRLGAQYFRGEATNELSFADSEPGTSPDSLTRATATQDDEFTFDEVIYHAGLAVEWERVVLEVLLTDSSGGSNRDGIDLDTAFVGATFKLAARN